MYIFFFLDSQTWQPKIAFRSSKCSQVYQIKFLRLRYFPVYNSLSHYYIYNVINQVKVVARLSHFFNLKNFQRFSRPHYLASLRVRMFKVGMDDVKTGKDED